MAKTPAIVLSSGGLHSLVCAGLGNREYRIAMLHIKDHRGVAARALAAFEKQALYFKPLKSWAVEAAFMRQAALPVESTGLVSSTSSDPQNSLMPFRELQLLAVALGFARHIKAGTVLWGAQYDTRFPDALSRGVEVLQLINQLAEALSPEFQIVIKTPLMGLEDQQVVELGYQMGLPFAATWTCQMDMDQPCMSCPACARRARAFRAAQLADPAIPAKK